MAGNNKTASADLAVPGERADLIAWRRRDALRRSNAAQPVVNKRRYRRRSRHRRAMLDA